MKKTTLLLFVLIASTCLGQDFKFGKVSEEELNEEVHPLDPDADAAILYKEQYSHIDYTKNDGFVLNTEVYERVKIYNTEGFNWGTHIIPVYKGGSKEEDVSRMKAVTYTFENGEIEETKLKDDGIFKEERNKYYDIEKFTMPNLKPGCIIEYKYTITSPYLSNVDEIRLQEEIPINNAEITFSSPEYFIYQMHRKGLEPLDIKESAEPAKINYSERVGAYDRGFNGSSRGKLETRSIDYQKKTYKINVENVAAIKDEAFSSNIDNYKSAIKFELSYTKYPNEPLEMITSSWEAVSKTIYDSENFGGQLKNDRFFDDEIDELLVDAASPEEKTSIIYNFVKQKMNWNNYIGIYADDGVKSAFKNGVGNTGDINLLLVNMLQYAGLSAHPVILSTRDNGIPLFPTREGFNYVIAGVDLNGSVVLMDATNKIGAIGLLEEKLLNWNGRLIRDDGSSEWVSLYPKEQAIEKTMLSAQINEDLSIESKAKTQFNGHYGLLYRKRYIGKSNEECLEVFEDRYSGVEVEDFDIANLQALDKPVELSYDFEMLGSLEEIGDKIYLSPLFHLATLDNPFKSEERQHPVDFKYPWKDRFIISLRIPEGYKVESLPEGLILNLSDNLGSFKFLISEKNGLINVSNELAINDSIISPDYYQDLKKFYELVVSKQNEKIVLVKI